VTGVFQTPSAGLPPEGADGRSCGALRELRAPSAPSSPSLSFVASRTASLREAGPRWWLLLLSVLAAAALGACQRASAQAGHRAKPAPCVACHLPEYQSAKDHQGKKPTRCEVCHASDAWHPTGLHHKWPLVGAHEKAQCFDCHKGDPVVFNGTPKACVGCHRAEYDAAADHPGHFATTCEDCHTTVAWKTLVEAPKWPAAQPTASASASTRPEESAKPPPQGPKAAPHPKPKPKATATATTTPPQPPPDTTTHASPRR
jgi:hypothetical protein